MHPQDNPSAAPKIAEIVHDYAERARSAIERAVGMAVDYEDVSLAAVDHYVVLVRDEMAKASAEKRETVLALVAQTLGAYFGEFVRQNLGGVWSSLDGGPDDWRLEVGALWFSPTGLVKDVLCEGSADDVDAKIHAPLGLEARLYERLTSAAPVPASYFHSLTGRYETLVRMRDDLVEARD